VDIEQFYDGDERRRASGEIELGDRWFDPAGLRHTMNYVIDTSELYVMAAPDVEIIEDGFGDMAVDDEPVDALTVEILAVIPTVDELHAALSGWEGEVGKPGSLDWVRARVTAYPPA